MTKIILMAAIRAVIVLLAWSFAAHAHDQNRPELDGESPESGSLYDWTLGEAPRIEIRCFIPRGHDVTDIAFSNAACPTPGGRCGPKLFWRSDTEAVF
ncbi:MULTISPECIES: hypothetical protein [Bradyrhizobium]|uniref:hypothetical protein n=1 Tax=Bradyrhizobium TaxID=374 RepID=UPI0004B6D4B5|nr:hypothetical protein [Bradyrhizobium liaoningense]WLB88726.1 hypothetical protein QIH91_40360 [Bradyrhizobium japonicum USDA 135]GLR97962.1 hypothetical protein GCM10007858_56040 [Bradyrhizobium liaoningense]